MIRARRGEMALGKGRMGYERGEGTKKGENGAEGGKVLGDGEGARREEARRWEEELG